MHAIVIEEPGSPEALRWREVADLSPAASEVLLDVAAAGVNRADIMQRLGHYPPPQGTVPYPGLECSGRIAALGEGVSDWNVGDEVCALLAGGGYAEQVAVPAGQLLPIPGGMPLARAAGLPEVACTVYANVFMLADLRPGENFLVHGGAGGIGTMAIQLARNQGARVLCTAGSAQKLQRCRELGADVVINYREEDFATRVKEETGGRGADVILDSIGAKYLPANVDALATGGRLVIIGLQKGRTGELDLGKLLGKRGSVHATSLRSRPVAEKTEIVAGVRENVLPALVDGSVQLVIDRTLPLRDAAEAHHVMESSSHVGKIVLTV